MLKYHPWLPSFIVYRNIQFYSNLLFYLIIKGIYILFFLQEYTTNFKMLQPVHVVFEPSIKARSIKFTITTLHNRPSFRLEVVGGPVGN